jgi:hypothetical protein
MQKIWLWVIWADLIFCGSLLTFVFYKTDADLFSMLPAISIALAAFAFIVWIFIRSKLIITIDSGGINYRYPIFKPKWKKILKDDIHMFAVKNYDAIFEYGGWGIKNSKKHGRCITIQGDAGLLLELKNGERILIGTQNKDGFERAMKRLMQTPAEPD